MSSGSSILCVPYIQLQQFHWNKVWSFPKWYLFLKISNNRNVICVLDFCFPVHAVSYKLCISANHAVFFRGHWFGDFPDTSLERRTLKAAYVVVQGYHICWEKGAYESYVFYFNNISWNIFFPFCNCDALIRGSDACSQIDESKKIKL